MFTNKKTLLAMSVASVFALSGCSSDDDKNEVVPDPIDPPTEVVVPPEAPAELGAVVNGNIVDSATLNVVPSTVMFFENGVASTSLVDEEGNAVTSVTTEDGNFSFLLKDGADVNSVTAVVMADSYVQKTFVIDLSELSEGDLEVLLPVVSEETEGLAVEETSSTVSGGSSADPITGGVANGKATAAVTVPGGTVLQDADGNPVEGDSVTLSVTAADTSSSAGAAITPEGLNAGSTTTVKQPVGVASVEMVDSNGVKIKKFSQPITVSMAIPADKGVSTGDMLTLVSQNEDTGVWTTETQQVEVKDLMADGSFYNASFMTDHLTFFAATTDTAICANDQVTINFSESVAKGLQLKFESETDSLTKVLKASEVDSVTISGKKFAADGTARITLVDKKTNDVWYDSVSEEAICGTTINASVTAPAEVTLVDSVVTLTTTCSNDESAAPVSATGSNVKYYLDQNKAREKATSNGGGVYTLTNMIEGETYFVSVKYSGALASLNANGGVVEQVEAGSDVTINRAITCDVTTSAN